MGKSPPCPFPVSRSSYLSPSVAPASGVEVNAEKKAAIKAEFCRKLTNCDFRLLANLRGFLSYEVNAVVAESAATRANIDAVGLPSQPSSQIPPSSKPRFANFQEAFVDLTKQLPEIVKNMKDSLPGTRVLFQPSTGAAEQVGIITSFDFRQYNGAVVGPYLHISFDSKDLTFPLEKILAWNL